ncbi:MAG TPA: hypothetical protein VN947_12175 [Polyangia bacterium]|nr:hypothetical protein [Polyangia bacterium]
MRAIVAISCLLVACGSDDAVVVTPDFASTASDLSVPMSDDLARANDDDMSCTPSPWDGGTANDAAGFCDNTPIAGTCVQTVFAKIAACFAPAGCCTSTGSIELDVHYANGARWRRMDPEIFWSMPGEACGAYRLGAAPVDFALGGYRIIAEDGSYFDYYASGDVVCSDGSSFYVGDLGSTCPDIKPFFFPPPNFPACGTPTCCAP